METFEVVAVHPRAAHRPVTPLRVRVIAALLLALAPAQAWANAMHTQPDGVAGEFSPPSVSVGELEGDAALAARYLAGTVSASGRMRYVTIPGRPWQESPRYNVLRHAGSVFALASYLESHQERELRPALLRAAGYLVSCCLQPVPGKEDLLAIWSTQRVTGRRADPVAKLGGAGLALLALATVKRIEPEFVEIGTLRRLARFILSMQKPSGEFFSKYVPAKGGRLDRWRSLYYPGEAALGLLGMYDHDPSEIWLNGASRGLHFLARSRAGAVALPPDHWALIATDRLMRLAGDVPGLVDEQLLVSHVSRIVDTMLQEQAMASPHFPGAFTPDGRTAPTATRIEGLTAAYRLLASGDPGMGRRVMAAIGSGVDFLRGAMLREGPHTGGLPRAPGPLPSDGSRARVRFNRRAAEVRIDYVQHALSGFMDFASLLRRQEPWISGASLQRR